jgi:hypothetical protein
VSRFFDAVVMEMSSLRRWCISVAVVKPIGTSLDATTFSNARDAKTSGLHTFTENFGRFLL